MKKPFILSVTVLLLSIFLSSQSVYAAVLNPTGNITYTLRRSDNPSEDQLDAYRRIERAMDSAIGYYNTYTTITKALTVEYNTGVQTADGNFNGNIRFGSNRSFMSVRVALHEIAHTVGVGTTSQYRDLIINGVFTGSNATAMLREITGDPDALLRGDAQHFWPYGLNYDNEVSSEQDFINHCRIVNAIYADLFNEEFFGVVRLYSLSAQQCMIASGDSIHLGSCSDSASLITLVSLGNDTVFRLGFGNRVLDIPGVSTSAGVAAVLWAWNGGNNQRTRFSSQQHSGDDVVRISMAHSGHYLRAHEGRVIQDRAGTAQETQYWQVIDPGSTQLIASEKSKEKPGKIKVVNGTVFLDGVVTKHGDNIRMSITDFRGRVVKNRSVYNGKPVRVNGLSSGIYILKLSGRERLVQRLVVE